MPFFQNYLETFMSKKLKIKSYSFTQNTVFSLFYNKIIKHNKNF